MNFIMSSLRTIEKRYLEDLFEMGNGYVLEFSNNTFAEFFRENVRINIYDDKYFLTGDSKAKRLRAFWEIEKDDLVGKVLSELLEVWKYENNDDTNNSRYIKCKKIVERLIGNEIEEPVNDNDFLRKDFGNISINNLKVEPMLLPILEARLKEAFLCFKSGSSLATIFLCGSILEGMLLGVAQKNIEKFNRSSSSPKTKDNKVKNIPNWTLNDLINVAHSVGLLGLDVKKFSHALRDFRNYIHPYQQMLSSFNPDKHTAEMCLQVIKAAISDLSE